MPTRCKSVFDIPDVAAELADLHDKYVVAPEDKVSNNTIRIYKTHHIICSKEELGLNTSGGNPTYKCTLLSVAISKYISNLIASVEAKYGFQIQNFIFTDLFHGYMYMAGVL